MDGQRPAPEADESFAALFEQSLKEHEFRPGAIVQGTVIKVTRDYAVVDIGFKAEGHVPLREFRGRDGGIAVAPGERVDVLLEALEDDEGLVSLSKEQADRLRRWDELAAAAAGGGPVDGVVTGLVKGGLSVSLGAGIRAFLPTSQVDLRPVSDLGPFIGGTYRFKVLKLQRGRSNIVVSRRALLEEERAQQRQQALARLEAGQLVDGVVKSVTDYGAFIDLGGVDGLLHVTDISWGRVGHPSEVLRPGDPVRVKVLKVDAEAGRVSLGLKQTTADPRARVAERYTPGMVVRGRVVSIKDYGAFLELGEGIDGLVHVSDLSWTRVRHPSELLKKGDEVEAVVLGVSTAEGERPRISLGMKQLTTPDATTLGEAMRERASGRRRRGQKKGQRD